MAKRKGVNKSQAIRDLYAKTPKMPVRLAVERLAKDGIKVAPSQVYFVLGGARGKVKRQRRKRAAADNMIAKATGSFPIAAVFELRKLAKQVGGIDNLKLLVDALAE